MLDDIDYSTNPTCLCNGGYRHRFSISPYLLLSVEGGNSGKVIGFFWQVFHHFKSAFDFFYDFGFSDGERCAGVLIFYLSEIFISISSGEFLFKSFPVVFVAP